MRVDRKSVGPIRKRVADDLRAERGAGLFDGLRSIGVDETSHRKGHTYMTVVIDHDRGRVIRMHDGHGGRSSTCSSGRSRPAGAPPSGWSPATGRDGSTGACSAGARRPNASSTASTSSPGPPTRSTRSGPLRMARDQEVRHGPQRRQGPDQGRPVGAAEERVGPERRPTRPARVRREHQRDPLDRVQARGTPRDDPQAGARTHPCAASRNSQNSERRSHGATSTSDKGLRTFSWR